MNHLFYYLFTDSWGEFVNMEHINRKYRTRMILLGIVLQVNMLTVTDAHLGILVKKSCQ